MDFLDKRISDPHNHVVSGSLIHVIQHAAHWCKWELPKKEKSMGKLDGKVAVITGGSSGIGLATAKCFVEEGAHVVITGRREKELKDAASFINRDVTTVVGDVSRLEDLDRIYAVVKEKHGHIDVLFA